MHFSYTYYVFSLLFFLNISSCRSEDDEFEEDPNAADFEKYIDKEERYKNIIKQAVKRIRRYDFELYPYIQKLATSTTDDEDRDKNMILLKYSSLRDIPHDRGFYFGTEEPDEDFVAIKTEYIDMTEEIISFPIGEKGLGYPINDTFIVFRKSLRDETKHYFNIAYVRNHPKYFVEWNYIEPTRFDRTRIQRELCWDNVCDLYHILAGICGIVSRRCKTPLTGPPEINEKFMWLTNIGPEDELPILLRSKEKGTVFTVNFTLIPVKEEEQKEESKPEKSKGDKNANKFGGAQEEEMVKTEDEEEAEEVVVIKPKDETKKKAKDEERVEEVDSDPDTERKKKVMEEEKAEVGAESESENNRKKKDSKRETDDDEDEDDSVNGRNHIPNSLDLLMLKRDNDVVSSRANGEEDVHFESKLVGERSARKLKEEEIQDCVNCVKYGPFYDDFEEEKGFSELIGKFAAEMAEEMEEEIAVDIENEGILRKHPMLQYLGNGHCPLTEITHHQPKFTRDPDSLAIFILQSLRVQCVRDFRDKVRAMFTAHLLRMVEIRADYSIGLVKQHPILSYDILTNEEFRAVMNAVFLTQYIKLYREGQTKLRVWRASQKTPLESLPLEVDPKDERLSKSIRFFTKLILNVVDALGKDLQNHTVRGHRFVLRLLRDKINSVLVKIFKKPKHPMRHTWNKDILRLMGIKEFLLYGMGPTRSGTSAETAFKSFVEENEKRMRRLVVHYGISLTNEN